MLDQEIEDLKKAFQNEIWAHASEEEIEVFFAKVRSSMANYAFAACIDSSIRQEAETICMNEANKPENL